MDTPTIVRERKLAARDVLAPAALVVVACLFESLPLGVCVAFALALAFFAYMMHDGSLPRDQLPIVLEISSKSLFIRRRQLHEVEIPWEDVEAMQLSRGAKGAVNLDIRVTDPERYLTRFVRLNLAMSRYHLSVRVSGLDHSPEKIALAIEDAQKVFLRDLHEKNGPIEIVR